MLQTVAIRTPKHLCVKDNALVIREKKSTTIIGKIALSDIWVIIIDNPRVTMTSALISSINDAGIGVLYCGSNHMPNGLALPLGAHSRHAEIVEHQLAISKPLRNQIWKRLRPTIVTIRVRGRNFSWSSKMQRDGCNAVPLRLPVKPLSFQICRRVPTGTSTSTGRDNPPA